MTYEKRKLMKIKLLAGSLQIFSHVKSLQMCDEVETSFWFIVLEKETETQNISVNKYVLLVMHLGFVNIVSSKTNFEKYFVLFSHG